MEINTIQPEKRTNKRTETHSCDCISRKRVLEILTDIFYKICKTEGEGETVRLAKTMISVMPSAQPEIIRCKGCKYYVGGYIHCNRVTWWNGKDDYCSRAERRTDERSD